MMLGPCHAGKTTMQRRRGVVELTGKVAVVTGAASGIGRGLAERFAQEGMKLVLADVQPGRLEVLAEDVRAAGTEVLTAITDVSKAEAVEVLAEAAYSRFGAVHVLCNNAGIVPGARFRPIWEYSLEDWAWGMGVNLMGVVHGIRSFVPRMRAARGWGHVVNTISVSGLASGANAPVYGASKHAAMRATEALYASLRAENSPIGVTALCPGVVLTSISDSERTRPKELMPAGGVIEDTPELKAAAEAVKSGGLLPPAVAEMVVQAIHDNQFYLLTTAAFDRAVRSRMEDILARRNPSLVDQLQLSKEDNDARA
jgi:NAD(P)-dependent dehydrogenase (short-subunit alcohol dehydrogenase family)